MEKSEEQLQQESFRAPTEAELQQVQYALRTYGGEYGQRLANALPQIGTTAADPTRGMQ